MKALLKRWNYTLIIVIVSMLVGLTSCIDKNYFSNISDDVELTPGFALPLAHGSLALDDLLTKLDTTSIINQTSDSLLYIYYSADLFSYLASDVIDIPDQDFLKFNIGPVIPAAFVIPGAIGDTITEITIPFIGTVIPLKYDQDLEFTFDNGERIDSVILKNIRMFINVKSTFQNELILDFHTDNITVDGKPWRKRIPISGSVAVFEELINDFKVQLTFNQATTKLALKIDILLINKGETIRPGDNCEISMSFKENVFTGVYGYLGEYDILSNSGQIDVSFLNSKVLGGTITFADPELILSIDNSFAVPIQVDLGLKAISATNNNPPIDITFTGRNPFTIGAPSLSNFNEIINTLIIIDKDSSNLIQALETSPDSLNYTANVKINPGGESAHYNYITDKSSIAVGVEVTLPIDFKARGFVFEDTISLDFEGQFGNKFDMIESLGVTLDITNGIPLEADIQVYFTDSSYNILDSMFIDDGNFLESAILAPDGKHTISVLKSNKIEYVAASLEKIKGGKFARIRASLNTPIPATGSEYFKFYSFYEIKFIIGASASLRVNPKNL